jgi:hypothetical protein
LHKQWTVNMSYSALVDPAIPANGGPDDFLERQSLFLVPDQASERCDAR